MADISRYLKLMVEKNASDLFFSGRSPVQIKIQGVMRPIGDKPIDQETVKALAYGMMSESQIEEYERELEMNFARAEEGFGRFRVNVYRQRGEVAMVIRYIRSEIPSVAELNLPAVLEDLILERSGLILVVGATGSGKSTALASMLEYRNRNRSGHILTIEDPIEFVHENHKSLFNQREVGLDTHSYSNALKNAMREAPDVIMIGEIRDRETMEQAIRYSETGHLCVSTLHANNTNQALEHIVNFFHETESRKLNMDLSLNMRAVISLRLIKGVDGMFIPATEILVNTPFVTELISKGHFHRIKEAIEQGGHIAMHTFDECLIRLYQEGKISAKETLHHADSRNNVALQLRLDGS